MTNLWSFLLQTLTASSAAVLLLVVKAMFRDKLSPRWQFAAWGVLALVLLFPAGINERYALVNWPFLVEALKSAVTGDYSSVTHVFAPIPLPALALPTSFVDWLYLIYVAGAAVLLLRYILSYVRLRRAIRREIPTEHPQVQAVAARYDLPACPVILVPGLPSAFICGVFRPVLALPAGVETDDKVILHELMHLTHRDAAWGLVICFFRCLHWCNPLLWACANLAQNDLESLCDQRVLERLEGEERREYGHILLSMADEKYARVPGTSSMANGLPNIRRRIQAIARFKKFPAGMALASVCILLVIVAPLIVGINGDVKERNYPVFDEVDALLASARTTPCTTCDGALDTYAKSVLAKSRSCQLSLFYRAICAPLSEQDALALSLQELEPQPESPTGFPIEQISGTSCWANPNLGYKIYNLNQIDQNHYEAILLLNLADGPLGEMADNTLFTYPAVQSLQVARESGRWVVLPQNDIHRLPFVPTSYGEFPNIPSWKYEAQAGDFTVQIFHRRISSMDTKNYIQSDNVLFPGQTFQLTPYPSGVFDTDQSCKLCAVYTGTPENKAQYTHIGLSAAPLWAGQTRPELHDPGLSNGGGGSSDGSNWASACLNTAGGLDIPVDLNGDIVHYSDPSDLPAFYAADLYLNGELVEKLTLLPAKGGASYG